MPYDRMPYLLIIIIIIFHFYSADIDYILKTAILKFKNKRLKTKTLKIQRVTLNKSSKKEGLKFLLK